MGIRWEQMSYGRGGGGRAAAEAPIADTTLAHRGEVTTEVAPLPRSPAHDARLRAATDAFAVRERAAGTARARRPSAPAALVPAPPPAAPDDDEAERYDEESDPDVLRFEDDVEDQRSRLEILRDAAKRSLAAMDPVETLDAEAVHLRADGVGMPGLASRARDVAGDAAFDGDAIAVGDAAAGSRFDRFRRGWGSFYNRARNAWMRRQGVREEGPSIAEPLDAFRPLDRDGPWVVHRDDELVRHRAQHGAAITNVNRVDRVWYGDPRDPTADGRMGFFKPEPGKDQSSADAANGFQRGGNRYRLAARAVMSSAIDKALGTNAISDESFAEHLNWATGKVEMGNFSAGVDGTPLRGGYVESVSPDGKTTTVVQGLATTAPLRSAEAQRGLSNLQVVDWLTAQVDRHGGNIFMTPDGVVKGIDNDLAFFDSDDASGGFNRGLPPVVHRPTADAVLSMTEDDLRKVLDDAVPPTERLTHGGEQVTNEMNAALARLRILQEHLRANPGAIVDGFDDATFDRMRAQNNGRETTYLGAFASMAEGLKDGPVITQVRTYDDDGNVLSSVENRLVLDDPDADLSSWAVGWRPDGARGASTANDRGSNASARAGDDAGSGKRGRSHSDPSPRGASDGARGRAHTFDSAGDPANARSRPPRRDRGASSGDGGRAAGSNRSGEAETKGDEQRLGPGGETDLGEATAYARFINAFGRNPEAGFRAFQQQWERAVHRRAEVAVQQQAKTQAEGTLAEQANASLDRALDEQAGRQAAPSPSSTTETAKQDRTRARDQVERFLRHFRRQPPPWKVLTDGQVRSQKTKQGDAVISANRVDQIEYDHSVGNHPQKGNWGFFKPEPLPGAPLPHILQRYLVPESLADDDHIYDFDVGPPRLAARAVLSSALDRELGAHVLSSESFGYHDDWVTGRREFGNVSGRVPGRPLMDTRVDPAYAAQKTAETGQEVAGVTREMMTNVDLTSARVQEGLTTLQTLDFLSMQTDRHPGNIFVDQDGSVYGIDNDRAWGPTKRAFDKNKGMPPHVARPLADAILAMTPARYEKFLNDNVPSEMRLNKPEMDAAQERLRLAQEHLRKPGVVVDSFGADTFETLSNDAYIDGSPRGYLAQHLEALNQLAQNGPGDMAPHEGGKGTPVWGRMVMEDASFKPPPYPPGAREEAKRARQKAEADAKDAAAAAARAPSVRETIEGSPGSQWQSSTPGAWKPAPGEGWTRGRVAVTKAKAAVSANERKGTTTTESQGATAHETGERSAYTLKRRNHAGTSLRTSENKKTPARGTKKRASTTSHGKKRH